MLWNEIKVNIRADLLARGLKQPRRRLGALDSLEKVLANVFPNFPSNPNVLLNAGKEAVSKELARLKKTGSLNGAEKSVLNQIFAQLAKPLRVSPSFDGVVNVSPAVPIQRFTTGIPSGDTTNVKRGLVPIIGENSTILILGTLPGEDSLRLQQYYAHGKNQFWRILAEVYSEPVPTDYLQRLTFLHSKRLALWDVLRSAERVGSLDSDIKDEVTNDFADLLRTYPRLKAIIFNGGKARTLFQRHIERAHPWLARSSLRMVSMPSTSPTPGRNVLSFKEKVVRWSSLTAL